MTPQPLSPYAASKLACEHLMRIFTELYGLETVSLRYFNVFGPRQDPKSEYAAVIPKFLTAALRSPTRRLRRRRADARLLLHRQRRPGEPPGGERATSSAARWSTSRAASAVSRRAHRYMGELAGTRLTPNTVRPAQATCATRSPTSRRAETIEYAPPVDVREGVKHTSKSSRAPSGRKR